MHTYQVTGVVFEGHYVVCDKHLIAPLSMSFALFCQNHAVTTTGGINNHIDSGTRNSFCTVNRANSGDVFSNQVYNHSTWYLV